jgi:hypothetical protein
MAVSSKLHAHRMVRDDWRGIQGSTLEGEAQQIEGVVGGGGSIRDTSFLDLSKAIFDIHLI